MIRQRISTTRQNCRSTTGHVNPLVNCFAASKLIRIENGPWVIKKGLRRIALRDDIIIQDKDKIRIIDGIQTMRNREDTPMSANHEQSQFHP